MTCATPPSCCLISSRPLARDTPSHLALNTSRVQLLLLLYGQPVRDTLVQLARGLRCYMSGFNPNVCAEASDAFGVRHLATHLASTHAVPT